MSPPRDPALSPRRYLSLSSLFLASAALLSGPACAGQFAVSPVRIYMTVKDRAAAVTITNEGDEELVMQADVFLWKQKPDGEDELTPTEDLFLSPPIIKLGPKARQVVRLAKVRPTAGGDQLTYRLFLREIVEARPPQKGVEVQLALAFSLPVFITPPTAKSQLACALQRKSPDTATIQCENTGNAYVHPREFALTRGGGEIAAKRESGGYILPGIKRGFEIKGTGPLPAGPAKLEATLDDGSTRTFDVAIAE